MTTVSPSESPIRARPSQRVFEESNFLPYLYRYEMAKLVRGRWSKKFMIEINNLTTNSIDEEFLKRVVKKVLEGENKKEVELSIALIGQGRMRKLNKRYRGKNRVTDVLAFPESKVLLEKFKVGPLQKTQSLGEVVICSPEVKKNAKKYNTNFKKELIRCLIHGILHLLGYNHEKMEEKQKYYLDLCQNLAS